MLKVTTDSVILTNKEYEQLTHPDVTYTLMTKTAANRVIDNILKYFNAKCWHDNNELAWEDDWCCSCCPVMKVLGEDAGERICLKQKVWGK